MPDTPDPRGFGSPWGSGYQGIRARGMTDQQPRYMAYLIRLWEADANGEPVWRASAQSPHTGERHAFADLQRLFAFLEERTGRDAQGEGAGSAQHAEPCEG